MFGNKVKIYYFCFASYLDITFSVSPSASNTNTFFMFTKEEKKP